MRAIGWLAVLRDLILMSLGTGGMIQEIFFRDRLNIATVTIYLLMIAGTGTLNALWLARNTPTGGQLPSLPLPHSSPSEQSS